MLAASLASQRRTPRRSCGKSSSRSCQVVACRSFMPNMQKEAAPEWTFDSAPAQVLASPEVPVCCEVRPLLATQPAVSDQPSEACQPVATAVASPRLRATPRGSRASMVGGARRASSRRARGSQSQASSARAARAASADHRRVGARLQSTVDVPVIEASFEPSRVRTKLQAGSLSVGRCRSAERPREFKTPSASHSLNVQSGVHGEKYREIKDL